MPDHDFRSNGAKKDTGSNVEIAAFNSPKLCSGSVFFSITIYSVTALEVIIRPGARVTELVDVADLKSAAVRRTGSIPVPSTTSQATAFANFSARLSPVGW